MSGWRYHKRVRLFKNCWINLSKGTPSISLREGPATLNFKPGRGIRVTENIPGTSISWSQDLGPHRRRTIQRATIGPAKRQKRWYWWPFVTIAVVLWGMLAHSGKHVAAPTSPPQRAEAPSNHMCGQRGPSAYGAAYIAPKALLVDRR